MTTTENTPYFIAWDTETEMIGINAVVPDLICSTFYDLQTREDDILLWSPRPDHSTLLGGMFADAHVITHNGGGFDLGVAAKFDPMLLDVIWPALRENRVHCTMVREMLLNLATHGSIDNIPVEGVNKQISYSLAALVLSYLGEDISAAKDDEDSPRTNYSLMKNVPLSDWPEEYVSYAKADAIYTGRVFLAQEARRQRFIEERGIDPLVTEGFRVMVHFSLSLMTKQGNRLDPAEVLRVTEEFQTMYNDPELVKPLVEAGIIVPAQPPTPNARGTKEHLPECPGHKEHPEYKKSKAVKDCDCPVKMNIAKPEATSITTLHEYIWEAAKSNDLLEVWASDSLLADLAAENMKDETIEGVKTINQRVVSIQADHSELPKGWRLCVDKEWLVNFAALDPVLEKYAERKKIEKIVTSYLPKFYWAEGYDQCPAVLPGKEDKFEGKTPAARIHSQFSPLKETGRCSSRAATKGRGKNEILLHPSANGQQVDPRVRGCYIPDQGNVLFSLDYSAMELGTAAQVCIDLFGYSVLGDKINAGIDTHAFLGAQIAAAVDPYFAGACGSEDRDAISECFFETKGFGEKCDSEHFQELKQSMDVMWDDFFKHYRKFAKPTGLGYPGGLGPKTFIAYAKGTYGVTVDLETATLLREVWRNTYPELAEYLEYINKSCGDPWADDVFIEEEDGTFKKKSWYCYSTPLGMYRARCAYTACANGKALQSPSAEGALGAAAELMESCTIGSLAGKVFPSIFIHDEIFGEMRADGRETLYVEIMDEIMVRNMQRITPDVAARTEPSLMHRWSKLAEPVWEEKDGKKILVPWVPKEDK